MKKDFLLLVLCFLILPAVSAAQEKVIQLQFKPKSEVTVSFKKPPPTPIYFEGIKDKRQQPRQIGENQEDKRKFIRILTVDDRHVGDFVTSVFKQELRSKGFRLEVQPTTAEKILSGSVLHFWTVEEKRYQSETRLQIELKNKAGELLFQKVYSGSGINRGRSLSEVNYQESISQSLVELLQGLLSDGDFLAALVAEPPVAPPA